MFESDGTASLTIGVINGTLSIAVSVSLNVMLQSGFATGTYVCIYTYICNASRCNWSLLCKFSLCLVWYIL